MADVPANPGSNPGDSLTSDLTGYQGTLYPGGMDFGDLNERLSWYPANTDGADENPYLVGTDPIDLTEAKTGNQVIQAAAIFNGNPEAIEDLRDRMWQAGLYADSGDEFKKEGYLNRYGTHTLDPADLEALLKAQRSMTDAGYKGFVWEGIEGGTGPDFIDTLILGMSDKKKEEGEDEITYGPTYAQLESWLDRNGASLPRYQLDQVTRDIVDGRKDMLSVIKGWTKTYLVPEYGAFADDMMASLDSDEPVDAYTLAGPYIAAAAGLLEMPEDAVDLSDKAIAKAMTYKNDKGEPVRMGMTEFQEMVKRDPRWEYTNNAHDEIGQKMGWFDSMFGL